MNEEEEAVVEMTLDRIACRVLLESVNHRINDWPGGEAGEQQLLFEMQDFLRRCVLELSLNIWQKCLRGYRMGPGLGFPPLPPL